MLFDLRGRGRRRTVQLIYLGLALLMGVGLIGFGIGGGVGGGGLLNAGNNGESSGSASFANQVKKYKKLTQQQPSNVYAWEQLTKNLLHEAGGEAYVSSTGVVSSKGKELFSQASEAWSRYIALNPPKPNAELAQLMVTVYSEAGLNKPAQAVEVLQIATAARPTDAAYYSALAEYAYKAKNTRVGDLASAKAVSLAPAAQKARVKKQLAEIKKNPTPGSSGSTSTAATGSSENTGTTVTVGGKTYSIPSKDLHVTSTPTTTSTKKK
jgi:hypothetical protein